MFIGRLAQLTGCTPKAILQAPQRSGRYRVYTPHHLAMVQLIRRAQQAAFKLAEMKPLHAGAGGGSEHTAGALHVGGDDLLLRVPGPVPEHGGDLKQHVDALQRLEHGRLVEGFGIHHFAVKAREGRQVAHIAHTGAHAIALAQQGSDQGIAEVTVGTGHQTQFAHRGA